ncbi:MAG: lipoyl(octanoyl) transferase LipB, partial [Dermatophilaceae bacterium]
MRMVHLGFAPDVVDYHEAWQAQRDVHAQVVAGELDDTVLLLEHAAVYTAGKRTEARERPTDGTPVIDVDRGGKITWHGPGQLVGYPVVRLPEVPIDVVAHVRRLEEVMIRACREFGVETVRVDGRSGVWVLADDRGPDRKLGAIGVRVSRRVT